jgi:hypothetical protein
MRTVPDSKWFIVAWCCWVGGLVVGFLLLLSGLFG